MWPGLRVAPAIYSPSRFLPDSPLTLDDTLLALADPTRWAILARLSRGEARVTDLAQPFEISFKSVSKHIRLLERAGLIRRDVRGREHVLSLTAAPLDHAAAWIERRRALWRGRLHALDALLQEEDRARRPRARATRKGGYDRIR